MPLTYPAGTGSTSTGRFYPWLWRIVPPVIRDLVSNNNALLAVLKAQRSLANLLSGPKIRQTLQIAKQVAQWYSGYDQLLNPAIDLFNDAFLILKWWLCLSSCRCRRF